MHLNIRTEALQGQGLACWFPAEPQNLEQRLACSRCSVNVVECNCVNNTLHEGDRKAGWEVRAMGEEGRGPP